MKIQRHPSAHYVGAFGFFVVITAIIHWTLLRGLSQNLLAGHTGGGYYSWHFWWLGHAVKNLNSLKLVWPSYLSPLPSGNLTCPPLAINLIPATQRRLERGLDQILGSPLHIDSEGNRLYKTGVKVSIF